MGTLGLASRVWLATIGAALVACAGAQAAAIPESGTLDLAGSADVRISGLEELSFTGFSVARVGDVNGDGLSDVAVGAPQADARDRSNAGSVFVIFGRADAAPVDLANLGSGGYRIDGALPDDSAGFSLAPAGDLNGDGRGDLLVGAPALGGERPGAAWVVFGKPDAGGIDLATPAGGAYRIGGAQPGDLAGFSVGSIGDLDGDGRGDLLVGAPRFDVNDSDRLDSGAVFVVRGSASATDVDLGALGANGYRIDGEGHGGAGWSVDGSPDMNGDSVPDVVLGAPFTDAPDAPGAGTAYVAWGRKDTTNVDLASLGDGGFKLVGSLGRGPAAGSEGLSETDQGTTTDVDRDTLGEAAGSAVAALGDMNGDNVPDIAVGGNLADRGSRLNAGSVYFVHGKATPDAVDLAAVGPAAGNGYRVDGAAARDNTGTGVSDGGDVNGDGRRDMLVSSPTASPLSRQLSGATYVLFGSATETSRDLASIGDGGFRIVGPGPGDTTSRHAVTAGDVNGDGAPDLLLGGPLARPTPACSDETSEKPCPVDQDESARGPRAGAAFIVYSPKPVPPPPPDPGQVEEVQVDQCVATRNVEAIIDDSGSMAGTDPGDLRRRALAIMLAKPRNEGDVLGALEFGSEANPLFAPESIQEDEVPALIKRLRTLIEADNGGTNYNAAFASVAEENPAAGARVFITDGGHNEGEYTGGHAGGPPTYVLGLEIGRKGVDAKRLARIAEDTKGEYYPNVDDEDLQPIMGRIDSKLNCDIGIEDYPFTFDDEEDTSEEETDLEDGTFSSDVTISWDDPDDDLDIEEIVLERRGNRKPIARLGRKTIKRALKSGDRLGGGQLKVQGRSGYTFETLRVNGLEDGVLVVKLGASKLRGKSHAVTQVTQSRRRR
jgi:hypothetical protein